MKSAITFDQVRSSAQAAGLPIARLIAPRTAVIPSATEPGREYLVDVLSNGRALCTCEDGGDHCWHGQRAAELIATAPPTVTRPVLYCEAQDAYLLPDDDDPIDLLWGAAVGR